MTKKTNDKRPTDAELAILQVIWDRGPSTVRQVHDELSATQGTGYTTILKLMQIMTDKGLLERDTDVRPQIYAPAKPQKQTQKQLIRDLLDRAFAGSPGNLVLQALALKKSSPEELQEIRALLDQLEGDSK
jgi:predicted transcriptional regulator